MAQTANLTATDKEALYTVPFTHDKIKVKVLGLAFRNGVPKAHILLPYKNWDLWVPAKRVVIL